MNVERIQYWLSEGAQVTDRVSRFLEAAGILGKKTRNNPQKALPGQKAKDRAEEKLAKDNAEATAEAAPANEAPFYIADFKFLDWPASEPDVGSDVDDLKPYEYPIVSIHADDFRFDGRDLGELNIVARPEGESWRRRLLHEAMATRPPSRE